jgi:ABC-type glycerol-3-phosphate transport system permease component
MPVFPLHLENYLDAFELVGKYILNSIVASGITLVFVLFLSSLTGFVFARYKFYGKEKLYFLIIILLMIPWILTLIPNFLVVRDLGILNTRWAMILPWIAGGQVFGIFVFRNYYSSLPEGLFEAARIDGASDFQIYYKIAIPLSYPVLVAVGILNLVGTWNDIIWPLISVSDESIKPLSIGLISIQNAQQQDFGVLFSSFIISSVPLAIVFAFCMKYYIRGLTSGALKY